MRGNKVKDKLKAGEIALALSGHSISSDTIDFCGQLGFDAFWIEGEHGAATWDQLGDQSRACDLWGMTSIMRIHSHDPGMITRALDRGVNGVAVPHVNTHAQAEAVAKAARFAPLGTRGMYSSGRRGYGDPDYVHSANDATLFIALIEEREALDNLADILTVELIDLFFVAPSDLAQSLGYTGQPFHAEVQAAVQGTIHQITAAGRVAGTVGYQEALLARYVELGARFFLVNFDQWIKAGASQYLTTVTKLQA
jgi:4-hydroxy-2-oxoheptanedioate aldolase